MKKFLGILSLFLALVLTGCKKDKVVVTRPPIAVETIHVGDATGNEFRSYVGIIQADNEVPLSFSLGGKVVTIACRNGETVREGQVLVVVDSTQVYQAYLSAQATLTQAEDGYKRLKKVYDKGGVAEVKWVEMKTKLQQARSVEQAARRELSNCTMRAPMDGVVMGLDLQVGQTTIPGVTVLKVLAPDKLHVRFSVAEQEIGSIREGQQARVIMTSIADTVKARITYTSLYADALTHACEVQAKLPESTKALPGMAAKVELIPTDNASASQLIVPAHAVGIDKSGAYVWVIENGQAHKRYVQVSTYVANGVVITAGLTLGEEVVTAGMTKLYENAPI